MRSPLRCRCFRHRRCPRPEPRTLGRGSRLARRGSRWLLLDGVMRCSPGRRWVRPSRTPRPQGCTFRRRTRTRLRRRPRLFRHRCCPPPSRRSQPRDRGPRRASMHTRSRRRRRSRGRPRADCCCSPPRAEPSRARRTLSTARISSKSFADREPWRTRWRPNGPCRSGRLPHGSAGKANASHWLAGALLRMT